MTDNASRAAEAAWYFAPSGIPHDGFVAGFTAGVAWAREQSAAKPAASGEVAELRAEVEAAEAWQQNDTYSSRRGEYECRLDVAVSTMQDARRLLALRAAAGKPDAG